MRDLQIDLGLLVEEDLEEVSVAFELDVFLVSLVEKHLVLLHGSHSEKEKLLGCIIFSPPRAANIMPFSLAIRCT